MLTRADLLARHCRPLTQGAMDEAQVREQLAALPDWSLRDGAIARTYAFADYHDTIAFVSALAWMIHAEDHHPELRVGYDRCEVRFNTHSVGGVTDNDFICAAKADAIFARQFGGAA